MIPMATARRMATVTLPNGEIGIPSLPDIAYETLRESILNSEYEAGKPLRQEEIAQSLGVSRVPVREALKRLEVEGLVIQRPRRGYVVASLDIDEIEDIFDIRTMLEEQAGKHATLRRTEQDIKEVEALLHAMDGMKTSTPAEVQAFAERNREFHNRLFEASGRTQLCRMMIVLRNSVERYIRLGASIASNIDLAEREHYKMFEAFKKGDAELCGRLCREHCEHTRMRLVSRLRDKKKGRTAGSK